MKLFLTLLFLIPLSATASISEMTQDELREALKYYQRCSLTPSNAKAENSERSVSVFVAEADDESLIYFAEVSYVGYPEPVIYHLYETGFTFGGYISEGDRNYLGMKVSSMISFLSNRGRAENARYSFSLDASVTLSDHIFSADETYSNYCEFL